MKTGTELVDFIQHENRILCAGLSNPLDNISRQRADVSAPVSADLRFIVNAAETLAHEFPVHRPSDALSEGRLADARRANKTQDGAFALWHQFTHGEKFNDSLFDFF